MGGVEEVEVLRLRKYKSFKHFLRAVKRLAKKYGLEDDLTTVIDSRNNRSFWEVLREEGEAKLKLFDPRCPDFLLILEATWFGEFGSIYLFLRQ